MQNLPFSLGDVAESVRETVHNFALKEGAPRPHIIDQKDEFPTGQLLRDAKLYEIGAGTSKIRRMLIRREIFKETT